MNDIAIFKPFANALDRGFNSMLDDFERDFFGLGTASGTLRTKVDETEDGYKLMAEVPGLKEDQVNITYENGVISVEANYESKEEGEGFKSLRAGKFCKSYRIPDVDGEKINATLTEGILTVSLPKSEKAKPKRIEINKS